MPPGLVELIEGLTREVLRNNPSDIYGFCAGHVQQLLEIRDGPLQKKTLTLEEKIAKAQEKVRQRAEQRRQQYDRELLNRQSGKGSEIQATPLNKYDTPPILPQEATAVPILKNPTQIEQDLGNTSEVESSHEVHTSKEDPQQQDIKDLSRQDNVLKDDIKSEPNDMKSESKINDDLVELSDETSGNNVSLESTLNEPPNTDTPASKVEMSDNLRAPIADEEMMHAKEQSFKEDQKLVADDSALQEITESTPNPEEHILSTQIKSETVEKVSDALSQIENGARVDDQNSVTQEVNVISNFTATTQSDNITIPLNKEENRNSSETETIQNVIDPDITNQSNTDNVTETTNSDATVNKKEEDLQETNTFDISFKESPTVELQDPQMNPDMLESLLETNTDTDVVTLLTQDSTKTEFNSSFVDLQQDAFKHTTGNTDLSQGYKDNSKTNGIISTLEELEDNTLHKTGTSNIAMIENNNKENDAIDNNGDENTLTNCENPQIHNQDGNMDLETAAVTIQKVFRTFLFKSRASTFEDSVSEETMFLNETDKNKDECDFPIAGSLNERRSHGLTRMDTVLQTVNEEKSLSLSTDDSSTMSSAATVIQAHVRGFLVRNKFNSNKTVSSTSLAATNSNEPFLTSLEMDNEQNKNKTVLNIHIVPEGEEQQTEISVVKDDMIEGTIAEEAKNEVNAENIALETTVSDKAETVKPIESVEKMNCDEMDVVTPFISNEENNSSNQSLMHSGEFHDAVLPTKVLRSDTTVASGE
ncbi:hypothetical protein PYW08_007659 [Mythimna loreyi]|uniref:Uncharacterized protein n=1 Tax=Mythimna loreyi TaxID=667449 RepID=A0ACC2QGD6_9NEOP|nr:hypothetical protein PYW08_007659 [Mythimna loreyi]